MSIEIKALEVKLDPIGYILPKGGLKSESGGVIFKLPKNVLKTILGLKKSKFQLFLHLLV